jgi:hypothetical protein
MHRLAIHEYPEISHQVAQRGNHREVVFLTDDDCHAHLNEMLWSSNFAPNFSEDSLCVVRQKESG